MAPTPKNADEQVLDDILEQPGVCDEKKTSVPAKKVPTTIVWSNVVWIGALHAMAVYGAFLIPRATPATWLFTLMLVVTNCLGITVGAHRLWSHRAYKARLPLRILLACMQSLAFQNDIIEWSRDHRLHHKYSETDADPHNAKRGFFFSHCGWLMCRKHPEIKEKGKDLDMSDLLNDPVCKFQRKVYIPSVILLCFVLPTVVPVYFWDETAWNAFFICAIFRYVLALNITWNVNSVAHLWGNKPYDKRINPVETFFVTFFAMGEGFHNYHHVFPSDYTASEFYYMFNPSTLFIDFFAAIGWAYDRKKTPIELVRRRQERTGDGTTAFGY